MFTTVSVLCLGASAAEVKELRERVRRMEEHEREMMSKEIQFKEMQERIQKMEEIMEEKPGS